MAVVPHSKSATFQHARSGAAAMCSRAVKLPSSNTNSSSKLNNAAVSNIRSHSMHMIDDANRLAIVKLYKSASIEVEESSVTGAIIERGMIYEQTTWLDTQLMSRGLYFIKIFGAKNVYSTTKVLLQ